MFCYTNWWSFVCRVCGGTRAACEKTTWTQTSGIHLEFPSPAPQLRFNNCLLLYIDNVTAESFNSCASCRDHRQDQGIQNFFSSRTALKFMFQNTVYNRRAYHSSSVSATIETLLTTKPTQRQRNCTLVQQQFHWQISLNWLNKNTIIVKNGEFYMHGLT